MHAFQSLNLHVEGYLNLKGFQKRDLNLPLIQVVPLKLKMGDAAVLYFFLSFHCHHLSF
jgi:hypothetical protein